MNYYEQSLIEHEKHKGKIQIRSKVSLKDLDEFSIYYTPGVISVSRKIATNPNEVYRYTSKSNMIAVVSDGTSILGIGNLGPKAAIPVMEGKAIFFKEFGGVDAFPICLDTQDANQIIETVKNISPVFGGINLEDISSPKCAEIERALDKILDIPVFHDDQHGTAIVVAAAFLNALKSTHRDSLKKDEIKICICGAGSAGLATATLLVEMGYRNITLVGREGVLRHDSPMNWYQKEVFEKTLSTTTGTDLHSAMKDADVFIGASSGRILNGDMVRLMKKDSIIFALASPEPEIYPETALEAGAKIVGTSRSDFPNQITNLLAYPGIFRGALDSRSKITLEMKLAAVDAIAGAVSSAAIINGIVIPSAVNKKVHAQVAEAVYMASLRG